MSASDLKVENISWTATRSQPLILHPVSFHLGKGRVLGVVGPNGAGKSTLLRLLYRFNRPTTGNVYIGDEDIWRLQPRAAARKVAAVLQEQPSEFALTVRDIVALGRLPHRMGFTTYGHDCEAKIDMAMTRLDLNRLADRSFGTLSGGERQRVMMARALAQAPEVLILDEPTNHLDILNQLEMLQLIKELSRTIVVSLHDLNMAMQVCDDILVLQNGRNMGFGPPRKILTEDLVTHVFRVGAKREMLSLSATEHFSFHLPN